jgi:hypothetical protein
MHFVKLARQRHGHGFDDLDPFETWIEIGLGGEKLLET